MFDQLARTRTVFLFVVNSNTGLDGGQGRSGPAGGRDNVVYHPQSRGEFGAGFDRDQGRFGIGQDEEQLAGSCGRKLLKGLHVTGAENFQVADKGDWTKTAAPNFAGKGGGLGEGDDFVAGIQTQLYNWTKLEAASTTL
jgi:hypothetical protein